MKNMVYRAININEIDLELFKDFNRHQVVKKCWRKIDGKWVLKDIAFTEVWGEKDYVELVAFLRSTITQNGDVCGAFMDDRLIGFSSVEGLPFGSEKQYLQLSCLHVSYESRGKGIGKKLFEKCCEFARKSKSQKLYISTHSAEESHAFYSSVGCVEATETNKRLVEKEPCDVQMEYVL